MKGKIDTLKEKVAIFRKSNARYRIKRILEYGIFWSLSPCLGVIFFSVILGYPLTWIGNADYLLLALGIAVNTHSTEDDDEKYINNKHRKKYRKISFYSMLFCVMCYFGLFNEAIPILAYVVETIDDRGMNILQYVTTGIIVVNIICNILMEVDDAMHSYSEKEKAEKEKAEKEKAEKEKAEKEKAENEEAEKGEAEKGDVCDEKS